MLLPDPVGSVLFGAFHNHGREVTHGALAAASYAVEGVGKDRQGLLSPWCLVGACEQGNRVQYLSYVQYLKRLLFSNAPRAKLSARTLTRAFTLRTLPERIDSVPATIDGFRYIDSALSVTDKQAVDTCLRMERECGVLVGGSSGLNVYAAVELSAALGAGAVIVTVLPDRYIRTLGQHGNEEPPGSNVP